MRLCVARVTTGADAEHSRVLNKERPARNQGRRPPRIAVPPTDTAIWLGWAYRTAFGRIWPGKSALFQLLSAAPQPADTRLRSQRRMSALGPKRTFPELSAADQLLWARPQPPYASSARRSIAASTLPPEIVQITASPSISPP